MQRPRQKKLTRSRKDRVLAGVFGGLAAYFNISAFGLRLIYLILMAVTGIVPGIAIYLIMMVIIPSETDNSGSFSNPLWGRQGSKQSGQGRRELHDVEERDVNRREKK
jgi:phage shock protein C